MTENTVLRFDGISKSFPGVKALDNVSFSLNRGEVLALVGENGAGKSTLVKCLTGANVPEQGTIEVLGLRGHRLHVTAPFGSHSATLSQR